MCLVVPKVFWGYQKGFFGQNKIRGVKVCFGAAKVVVLGCQMFFYGVPKVFLGGPKSAFGGTISVFE